MALAVLQYFMRNNQPKTCRRDGAGIQEQVQPGGSAMRDGTIVLGGIRKWEEEKNYKKFVEFTNYFFSWPVGIIE